MNYLSVCSGVEAASVAWESLGWNPVGFSEIEPFPCRLLAHHYPNVKNYGDLTKYKDWTGITPSDVDVLVGGTPCQSFSIAGLRKGMEDPRGNLTLVFLGLVEKYQPQFVVWENVPGVLSSNKGRDFASFLGGLEKLGYEWCYRVLDAQHFGVPQRRRRVFVVASPRGSGIHPAAVLFEPESLCGDLTPSRETGEGIAEDSETGVGIYRESSIAGFEQGVRVLRANGGSNGGGSENLVTGARMVAFGEYATDGTASTLKQRDFKDATDLAICYRTTGNDGAFETGDRTGALNTATDPNQHVIAFSSKDSGCDAMNDQSPTMRAMGAADSHANGGGQLAVAFAENSRGEVRLENGGGQRSGALSTGGGKAGQGTPMISSAYAVRRLSPRECERLQGFPDDYTLIPGKYRLRKWRDRLETLRYLMASGYGFLEAVRLVDGPDGPRYKALGNSMAVPVMRWIGERIQKQIR